MHNLPGDVSQPTMVVVILGCVLRYVNTALIWKGVLYTYIVNRVFFFCRKRYTAMHKV